MKKRFLSLLLTLVMIVGMIPATALTASAAGIGLADFYTTIRIGDDVYDVVTMPGNHRGDGYVITSTGPVELVIELTNYNGGPIYIESASQLVSGEVVIPKIVVQGNCVINVPNGYDGYGIEYYSMYTIPWMDIEFDDGDASLTIQGGDGGNGGAVKVTGATAMYTELDLDVTGPVGSSFKVNMTSGEGVVLCHVNEDIAYKYGDIDFDAAVNVQILVPLDQYAVHASNRAYMGTYVKKSGAVGVNYHVDKTSSYADGYGVLWLDKVAIDSPDAWYEPSKPGSSVAVQNDNNTSRDTLDLLEGIYYEGNTIGRFTPFSGYMKDDFLYNSDGTMFRVGHDTVDVDLYGLRVYDIVNQCYVETRDQWFAMKLLPAGMYIQEYSYDVLCTKVLLDSAYIGFPTEEGKLNLTLDGQTMQHVKAIGHVPGTYGNLNDTSRGAATPELGQAIRVNSPVYYVYDEKPEINSVKVNGTSVADGGTITANKSTVTIKTNYDGLSDALTAYGCSVKQFSAYYLNGEKINVAALIPVDNGDGTITKTYNRNLTAGDELRVESWLEVTWPDGSKDRVDEHTVTAMYVDADFESISPVPTSTELTNKYTDLGTMGLGSAATNIEFKAFPKKLSAAAIENGWTTGRSISVTRDGVEIYNRTYADNELFGWNLKDNIDEGGTYVITLRIFAQKGEQIIEKTHKFRVFVKGSTIKTIALEGVGTPVIGKSPSTINTVKCNTDGVVVKRMVWTYWTSEMGGVWVHMPSGGKFEAGKRYAVEFELQTADGYSFTAQKEDMTVYINGMKARKAYNYDTDEFGVDMEFEAITTPEFTTQPVGGKAPYGGKYTVNWATNFTPCKIVVGEYNSLNQVVNQVEYSNTTTSVELPANRYGYVVIAYYNDANAKYSNKITITEVTPAFTTQPVGGEVAPGEKLTVTWATNFTPKKLQVLKYSQGYCTGTQTLDVNATTANVSAGDEYYVIRAYYSDSKYVDSNKFYLTEKVQTYTVTFKVDTTTVATKTVEDGKTVTAPTAPTQSGKTFLGWYTEGGQKYDFSKPVTGDITLIAKFKSNASGDVLLGDVNCDGQVNAVDSNLLRRCVGGAYTIEVGSDSFKSADINGDGAVNAVDSNYLKRMVAGEYQP